MNDPLEDRLRRLRPASLPEAVSLGLQRPARTAAIKWRSSKWMFALSASAAAAAVWVLMLQSVELPTKTGAEQAVFANSSSLRVEDVNELAYISEGARAWELVEVRWVDQTTHVSAASQPCAIQVNRSHRVLLPVELILD